MDFVAIWCKDMLNYKSKPCLCHFFHLCVHNIGFEIIIVPNILLFKKHWNILHPIQHIMHILPFALPAAFRITLFESNLTKHCHDASLWQCILLGLFGCCWKRSPCVFNPYYQKYEQQFVCAIKTWV